MDNPSYFSRQVRKEFVKFLEKTATKDETEIKLLLENYFLAANDKRTETNELLNYFTKDAKISSFFFKKNKASITKELGNMRSVLVKMGSMIFFDDVTLHINKKLGEAKAEGTITYIARDIHHGIRRFRLVKEDGRWLIAVMDWAKL